MEGDSRAKSFTGLGLGRNWLRRGALAYLFAACMVATSAFAVTRFDAHNYLPGVLYHLERAKASLEAGDVALALAHTEVVVHDKGRTVYIDLGDSNGNLRKACENAASRSLAFWNKTLGYQALTQVATSDKADIHITFSREVVLRGHQVGGSCSQSRSVNLGHNGVPTPSYSANIKARYQLPNGSTLNEDCLFNIVAHEIGHVYGLNDCTEPGHLMSPLDPRKPKFDLHDDELEALSTLRETVFEIQRSALAKSNGN